MTTRSSYEAQLRGLPLSDWESYLRGHSGLPGPRGNLGLADAFAAVADRAEILRLATVDDEYLRFCATEAVGRLVVEEPDNGPLVSLLRERACDTMWRVREAAARAIQIVGDHDRRLLRAIVADWIEDSEPFVRRAAVAAICEPRLLSDSATKSDALSACVIGTASIVALPTSDRSTAAVRNLRQALGYCWSVAIAADPTMGLAAFNRLRATPDPDARWIVAENSKKSRLRRLL